MSHTYPRPVVVLSQCLELEACRYNGQLIRAPVVAQLVPFVEIRPICPEVEIGLGVPRDPIRLVQLERGLHLMQPSTDKDVTAAMLEFNDRFLSTQDDVDGFILKSRSPSCGIKDTKIYGGPHGSQPSDKGAGLFGGAVLERFPNAAVEDEGRLTNFRLRHHFLTKLFLRARFRAVRAEGAMAPLVAFHAEYKLTFMAYHQEELRRLGRIAANAEQKPIAAVLDHYEEHLGAALARPPRYTSHLNVLQHAMGYFKDRLSPAEKRHFLDLLETYRAERATLATVLAVLQSWIVRFDEPYLARQAYFDPYPRDLLSLGDSARGG